MKENILPIGMKELGRFGVGEISNKVYLDSEIINTDAVLSLTRKQAATGITVAAFTALSALFTGLSAGSNYVYTVKYLESTRDKSLVEMQNQQLIAAQLIATHLSAANERLKAIEGGIEHASRSAPQIDDSIKRSLTEIEDTLRVIKGAFPRQISN